MTLIALLVIVLSSCSGNRNRVFAINPGTSNQSEYKLAIANNKIYWEPFDPVYQIQIFAGDRPIEQLYNNNHTGELWSVQAVSNQSLIAPIDLPGVLTDGNTYTIYLQAESALYSQDGILVFKYAK